ncbi:MAG TPA: 4-alpha-glucanotransferase, partial [Chloroflexi bacterium]|nr:4-alpha-glucanotransferase [Chloroflexota bacterium]
QFCQDYLNFEEAPEVSKAMIRAVWQSVAKYAMAPLQDLLGLGEECRFNLPGSTSGNWRWRMSPDALSSTLASELRKMNLLYSRLSVEEKQKYTQWLDARAGEGVKPH